MAEQPPKSDQNIVPPVHGIANIFLPLFILTQKLCLQKIFLVKGLNLNIEAVILIIFVFFFLILNVSDFDQRGYEFNFFP